MDFSAHTSILANVRSDRVRMVRALSGRSARLRTGTFLVEGPQAVRELIRFAPEQIQDLYLTETAGRRYEEIVAEARQALVQIRWSSEPVVTAMSADAQGVLAVANRALLEGSIADLHSQNVQLIAVMAHVRDPGNAGTVIRSADAAGADAVVLCGNTVGLDNPKLVRSTAGSLFHLPVFHGGTLPEVAQELSALGLTLFAADGDGNRDLDDLLDRVGSGQADDLSRPSAWVFGNEAWGLRTEDLAVTDVQVRVPIHGRAESLNLATAAAVCLYFSARAHRVSSIVSGDDTP